MQNVLQGLDYPDVALVMPEELRSGLGDLEAAEPFAWCPCLGLKKYFDQIW
jgi:hypothetical protein